MISEFASIGTAFIIFGLIGFLISEFREYTSDKLQEIEQFLSNAGLKKSPQDIVDKYSQEVIIRERVRPIQKQVQKFGQYIIALGVIVILIIFLCIRISAKTIELNTFNIFNLILIVCFLIFGTKALNALYENYNEKFKTLSEVNIHSYL